MFTNLFSSNGRIGRSGYSISIVIYIGIVAFMRSINQNQNPLLQFAELPMLWFLISQGNKRCHDINSRGWYQLIPFYFLLMVFKAGNIDTNRFGPSPKKPLSAPVTRVAGATPQNTPVDTPHNLPPANAPGIAVLINSLQSHKEAGEATAPCQTVIEIENVSHILVHEVLKKVRQLQKVNGFNYTHSGSTMVVTVNHEGSTHELLDHFYTLMPGIAVTPVNAGSLSLKIK